MNNLLNKIDNLYKEDAVHRNGFRIRQTTPTLAASNGASEMGELATAIELENIRYLFDNPSEPMGVIIQSLLALKSKAVLEELADVYAIVAHLCYMMDVTPEELERVAIEKLNLRFTKGLPND